MFPDSLYTSLLLIGFVLAVLAVLFYVDWNKFSCKIGGHFWTDYYRVILGIKNLGNPLFETERGCYERKCLFCGERQRRMFHTHNPWNGHYLYDEERVDDHEREGKKASEHFQAGKGDWRA